LTRFGILRWTIFAAALTPAATTIYWTLTGNVGPNPIDYITDVTGTSALSFLVITLSITPLRRLTGFNAGKPRSRHHGNAGQTFCTIT
jgi:sulfoxide reductase heme-binding subunit YedZ